MPEEKSQHETAVDLIVRFSECQNWPSEKERDVCLSFLAQGLMKAAARFKVKMELIVDRWAENSRYCPTEYDLLETAEEIWSERVRSTPPVRIGCEACDYTGWKHLEDNGQGIAKRCECQKTAA
jgi:hypothetical protein